MTTLNPPPTVAPVEIDLSPVTFRGHSDVQPFTYRLGMSYTAVLESMRKWLLVTLVPYLNSNFEDVTDAWVTNVTEISTAIDTALATQADEINTALTEQQAQVATELANTLNQITSGESAALNDSAVFNALQVANSQALAFLDARETVTDTKVHDAIQPVAGVAGPTVTYLSTLFNAKQNPRPFIYPEDYTQSGDAGDWGLAITRALAAANPLGAFVVLGKMYPVSSTIRLNSNDRLVGVGLYSGVRSPLNAPIELIRGTTVTNVYLANLTVDGNCETTTTVPPGNVRSLRFTGSKNIRLDNIRTTYNPDWAASFEQSSNVHVTNYVHEHGVATLSGGRDGIHFLDCNDVLLDGAKIHSGDDCVGITSQNNDINRITIRNVTGVSHIAAVVTLGNESTTSRTASNVTIENITNYNSEEYPSGRSTYMVKLRAQNGSVAKNIVVRGVHGSSTSYGLWLDGTSATVDSMTGVTISDVRVESTTSHAVYLNYVTHFDTSNMNGVSDAGSFDGLHLQNCSFGTMHGGGSVGAAYYGLQLNACVSVDVWGVICRDCGAAGFPTNSGGNLRVLNCTNCSIFGGQYVGATTVSAHGMSTSGNTNLNITTVPPTTGGAA